MKMSKGAASLTFVLFYNTWHALETPPYMESCLVGLYDWKFRLKYVIIPIFIGGLVHPYLFVRYVSSFRDF